MMDNIQKVNHCNVLCNFQKVHLNDSDPVNQKLDTLFCIKFEAAVVSHPCLLQQEHVL
jgi:hypothetical protein